MAFIDVSELLLDPDFIDPVQVIHRSTSIDQYGSNVITEVCFPTVASVQPTTGRDLERLPEALRVKDVRTFYLKADLVADGDGRYPYVIVYRSQRYQVINTKPWLNWGQGWNEGLCVREKPST